MITNERQYRLTRAQAQKFRSALDTYDPLQLVKEGLDPIVVDAQRRGVEQQLRELEHAISQYEALRSGDMTEFLAHSALEIGEVLVQGRVAQGLTQRDLAVRLGMPEQQVQRYEQERYQTANLGRIAEVAQALQLAMVAEWRVTQGFGERSPSRIAKFDPKRLPVRQMRKRGWLSEIELRDDPTKHSDHELAAVFVSEAVGGTSLASLHRQNLKLAVKADPYSLLAWKARVLQKARLLRERASNAQPIDPILIKKLVRLSQHADGVVDAVKLLRGIGILVVFEEHLPAMYLDGAALLLDNSTPVIGMTLRHDRLDNFWFVLLHELGHNALQRDSGLQDGFFDDDSIPSAERFESEADEFAIGALISEEIWKNSFVRFSKSRDQVVEFASRLGVGASVVAGRIRNERRDYSIFSDLVGVGEVKRRIAEAQL